MLVAGLAARGFRNLGDDTRIELAPGLALITGDNGSGKTNLLEAVFLALTGSSPRTNRLREVVGFGKQAARVSATVRDVEDGVTHEIVSAIDSRGERRRTVDGASGDSGRGARPPVIVFMPDRLELIKGPPATRRAHLDQLMIALWPSLGEARRAYGAALAQRNALLGAIRAGRRRLTDLDVWDETLAGAGAELVAGRGRTVAAIGAAFSRWADKLGLRGAAEVRYRPRVDCAENPERLRDALAERRDSDAERGHTTTGPHHDELALERDERRLRSYGSQGEQRLALLALLLAEREAVHEVTGVPPIALFDDVMSELDPERRRLLALALADSGQALVTTTEPEHVPAVAEVSSAWVVREGAVRPA